jgi:ligand-binding sensor domain-containing protein
MAAEKRIYRLFLWSIAKEKFVILFFFFANICCTITHAQTPNFKHYTVNDGLPSSSIYTVSQDSKGFVWVATDKGVVKFDGYGFKVFTTADGLPTNDIWDISEDLQGRIWFYSFTKKIAYLSPKDQQIHTIPIDIKRILLVRQMTPKEVSVTTSNTQIVINDKDQVRTEKIEAMTYGVPQNNISRVLFYDHGQRSIGEVDIGRAHKKILTLPKEIKFNVTSWWGFYDNQNNFFFWDNKSITKITKHHYSDKVAQTAVASLQNLGLDTADRIEYIRITADDKIFVRTSSQSILLNKNLERLEGYNYLKVFDVSMVNFDKEGNIWIATRDRGLFLLSREATLSKSFDVLRNINIKRLTFNALDSTLWIGTQKGEILRLKNDNITPIDLQNTATNVSVRAMTTDNNGEKWIAWKNGHVINLPYKAGNTGKFLIQKSNTEIYASLGAVKDVLFEKKRNQVWFATHNGVTALAQKKHTWQHANTFKMPGNMALAQGPDSTVWVGRMDGLTKIVGRKVDELTIEKKQNETLTRSVLSLCIEAQTELWVGTDGWGAYRYKNGKTEHIVELNGKSVEAIRKAADGSLWIATNGGLYVITVTQQKPMRYVLKRISIAQGLPTQEVNDVCLIGQKVYVATSAGLSVLNYENLSYGQFSKPFPLIIKNLYLNRAPVAIASHYDLAHTQNNIDIDFVGLSYQSDKNIRYEYRLRQPSASNALWRSTTNTRLELSSIAYGSYILELKAYDVNNQETTIRPITFVINPPFWKTIWFALVVLGLAVVLVGLAAWLRVRYIKGKEIEKTKINKKFAELELQALQAQMNPHFVFNALTAIQNFILQHNDEQALMYLNKFSRLMRLFLESTREKYISLHDEIQLLKLYIELEHLRFRSKFEYDFMIDENTDQTQPIPSMLIQPFIENAINHGLLYVEHGGYLNVSFINKGNTLRCVIEDNGVGREKSKALKATSTKSYKSRGIEITQDRVKTLQETDNLKISINIIDKTNPTGTSVEINIGL